MKIDKIFFSGLALLLSGQGFSAEGMSATRVIIYQLNNKGSAVALIQGTTAIDIQYCDGELPPLPVDAQAASKFITNYCHSTDHYSSSPSKSFYQKQDNRFVVVLSGVTASNFPPASCIPDYHDGPDCAVAPTVVAVSQITTLDLKNPDSLIQTQALIFQRLGDNVRNTSAKLTIQKYSETQIDYPEIQNKAIIQ